MTSDTQLRTVVVTFANGREQEFPGVRGFQQTSDGRWIHGEHESSMFERHDVDSVRYAD